MIKRTATIHFTLSGTAFQDSPASEILFFDIETTGFAARSSHLYLIGAIAREDAGWTAYQWFAENPAEEAQILQAFLAFAAGFSQLIHFNGTRFDLPYLEEKCQAYGFSNTLSQLVSRDLYTMIRPLKSLLNLTALNQKSLEEALGIYRRDLYSGGELIQVYKEYVDSHDAGKLNMLLLHNYEDLLGMTSLLPLLSYLSIRNGIYQVTNAELRGDALNIYAQLPLQLPQPVSQRGEHFYLSAENRRLAVQVSGVRAALKHFFADYKNYYYLPAEDTAIHKSVAAFVDKEFREPAKASTCYSRKKGFYLPQMQAVFSPVFKEDYQTRLLFFPCTDEFLRDTGALHKYLHHLISCEKP